MESIQSRTTSNSSHLKRRPVSTDYRPGTKEVVIALICNFVKPGIGCCYSVQEMILAFAAASGREVPRRMMERHPGDGDAYRTDVHLAGKLLD